MISVKVCNDPSCGWFNAAKICGGWSCHFPSAPFLSGVLGESLSLPHPLPGLSELLELSGRGGLWYGEDGGLLTRICADPALFRSRGRSSLHRGASFRSCGRTADCQLLLQVPVVQEGSAVLPEARVSAQVPAHAVLPFRSPVFSPGAPWVAVPLVGAGSSSRISLLNALRVFLPVAVRLFH